MLNLLIFFSLLSISQNILCETPIVLENGKDNYEIGLNLEVLEDKSGKLTIDDINDLKWSSKFIKSKRKVSNFGFSDSTFWIRFTVINNSNHSYWLLNQDASLTEKVDFFKKNKDRWERIVTGTDRPFRSRDMKDKGFIFYINPEKKVTYFLKIQSTMPIVNLSISSPKYLMPKRTWDNLISGLFFGLMISFFLLNTFIFASTRNLSYLYYSLYIISHGLNLFIDYGFSQRFIAPNSSWISKEASPFLINLTSVFLNYFSMIYLNLKNENPRIYKTSIFLGYYYVLAVMSTFLLPHNFNLNLALINSFLILPFLLYSGIYKLNLNYRPARYYLLGFSFFIGGVFIFVLKLLNFIPLNSFTSHSIYFGTALQIIFITIGLVDRINFFQEEALYLEKKKSQLLEELTIEVNKSVDEKTKTLNTFIENIDEGFFILDNKGIIQPGVTQSSISLFETDLENKKMEEVLKLNRIEKKKFNRWIFHAFKAFVPFKDLINLAPRRFPINKDKIIGLDYKPIFKKDDKSKISQIICIANDITEKVLLENKAQKEKEKARSLTIILDNSTAFLDLISDSEDVIYYYLKNLSNSNSEDIFRNFHTMKARFGHFRIEGVVKEIHELEGFLNEIEDNWDSKNISLTHTHLEKINTARGDFLRENRRLVELVKNTNNVLGGNGNSKHLINKIQSAFAEFNKEFVLKEVSTLFHQFITPVKDLARQQDKLVDIKINESNIFLSPDHYRSFFSGLLHVFRNVIDHGTENRDERVSKNKSEISKIEVSFSEKENRMLHIKIKDDGRGIDPAKIKSIAMNNEKLKELNLNNMKDHELISLIFEPGISSKDQANTISGRGIGMDVVKIETEKLGGKISVSSKLDEGTTFYIKLPIII